MFDQPPGSLDDRRRYPRARAHVGVADGVDVAVAVLLERLQDREYRAHHFGDADRALRVEGCFGDGALIPS